MEALQQNVVGRSTLIIAQRLSTVQKTNRIVDVWDGRKHSELMERRGLNTTDY